MEITLSDCIVHMYPHLKPIEDFLVMDNLDGNGPFIREWNVDDFQPTFEQLQTAKMELETNPLIKPLSEIEQLQKDQTDLIFTLMMNGVI